MSELKFYEHATGAQPKYLVIFLHGYGSNGENLLDLAYEFKRVLGDAHFISPNAIAPWEGGFPHCYQWFSLYRQDGTRHDLTQISNEIRQANQKLQNFIKAQLERFQLGYDKLFLVGFSQGAMMSIYQGLIMEEKPAGIISFSGRVILPEHVGEKIITKPQICLIHGQADSVLPFLHFEQAQEILTEKNISFEAHGFENLDHTIDIHGIRVALNFIKKQIA